jgi:hypothetical protein
MSFKDDITTSDTESDTGTRSLKRRGQGEGHRLGYGHVFVK